MTRARIVDSTPPLSRANAHDEPSLPQELDPRAFASPWEARAFALVVELHTQGRFTWPEWAGFLGNEIAAARDAGQPDHGSAYYELWLRAAAKLFVEKGILTERELAAKEAAVAANPVPPHGTAQRTPVSVDRGRAPS